MVYNYFQYILCGSVESNLFLWINLIPYKFFLFSFPATLHLILIVTRISQVHWKIQCLIIELPNSGEILYWKIKFLNKMRLSEFVRFAFFEEIHFKYFLSLVLLWRFLRVVIFESEENILKLTFGLVISWKLVFQL